MAGLARVTSEGMSASRIRAAMTGVNRADFLPLRSRFYADCDAPLSIGHGQTNSQPYTVAVMLELLDVHPGHRVLDVGSGSCWSTALLATLVEPEGSVVAVELVPELVEFGRANLARAGFGDIEVHQATDGVFGLPELAPFDRILVSAEAEELPGELIEQLVPGGVMVIPVKQKMLRVVRGEDRITVTRHGDFRFVPLLRSRSDG